MGGLGVKNLRCTSKHWRQSGYGDILYGEKALWRKVVQHKFMSNHDALIPNDDASTQGRSVWKNILNSSTFYRNILVSN